MVMIAAPAVRPSKPRPIDELIETYLRERTRRHEIVDLTARNQRSALRSLVPVLGGRQVDRLTARDIERWLEGREHLAAASRRSDYSAVRSFCAWLVRRGRLR